MFYVYNTDRTGFIEVNELYDKDKPSIHSDEIIPLEFSYYDMVNGLVGDSRDLEPLREQKRKEMDFNFNECIRKGSETCYVITTATSKLTGERIVMDNAEIDLTNMRSLIELMDLYDQTETRIRDYHNIEHPGVTLEEVIDIKFDMMLRGAELHTKKGIVRSNIESAKTLEELNAIIWGYESRKK